MSWRHGQAAGLIELRRPPAKAVLLTLCHHADQFTGECWPDVDRIMQFTGLSRRAVQMALRELEQLELVKTKIGGRGKANLYTLRLPGCEPVEQDTRGARPARGGAPHARRGAPDAPQQSSNNQGTGTRAAELPLSLPLPENWKPSAELMRQAMSEFTTCDVEHETALFIDTSRQKGTTYVDVVAAWRSWLRKGEAFARRDRERERSRADRGARHARGGERLRQAAADARGKRPRQ